MPRRVVILNVDDDDAGRYAVGRQLKQAGYEVIEAATGEGALSILAEQNPDLVLLDVRLPDIDGFEVCRRIRENPKTEGLPVIQMSASYLDTSSQVKGLDNGADAYLTEPTDPAILVATLKSVLRMKQAERTVRDSAAQWQSTFDAIQEGVAVLDSEGTQLRCNKAFGRIAGEMATELNSVVARGIEVVSSGKNRFTVEQSGAGKHLTITLDPLMAAGVLSGAVCVVTDITEKKRFEEKLHQTAKLESLGVLAGGIAHDFNNLLTGILGNSSLIADSLPDSAPERDMALEILKASQSAADLTRQILAYSGKGRFVMKAVDVSALAVESRSFVRRFVPGKVDLIFETTPGLPLIEADASQIQQVIMNLIINAVESFAETDRGRVTVRTALVRLDNAFFEGGEKNAPGDYIVLTVSDNGSGMDESTQKCIFDPFFTTKFAGRGLGLSAVHGIIQGHRGYLRLDSRAAQGSTFRLYFPVSTQAVPEKVAQPSRAVGKGSGTILLIDDEETVRNFTRMALESRGYKVIVAENGAQGVEIFRRQHESINLVLLDFTMPVMDGEEAFELLRAIDADVPVILSSGFSQGMASEKFRGKGLSGFLGKPYGLAQLTAAVEAGLKGADTLAFGAN